MDTMMAMVIRLTAFEGVGKPVARIGDRMMEFHVRKTIREALSMDRVLFRTTGNVILPDFLASRMMADRINRTPSVVALAKAPVSAGKLNAMALIDEILHDIARIYREQVAPQAFSAAIEELTLVLGERNLNELLLAFTESFPPLSVQSGSMTAAAWLAGSTQSGVFNRELAMEELILLHLANENRAFSPFRFLFDDGAADSAKDADASLTSVRRGTLAANPGYASTFEAIEKTFAHMPRFGPEGQDLLSLLRAPSRASPDSLKGQLDFMRKKWGFVAEFRSLRLLGALDLIAEEEKPHFPPGPGPTKAYEYRGVEPEYERYSPDLQWMPNVVMLAKSTLVWLHQLSVDYGRSITRLDQIPDAELDEIAARGFTTLWLIGLWERSAASEQIKKYCGNPEAAASAYSLFDYEIAQEIGGWEALGRLKERCQARGIRLGADMVPNHTGLDSAWIRERPELFISSQVCPFPGYSWNGPDLSRDPRVGLWLEDHYYDRSDAAVVFKRQDRETGRVDYIYHGNDGTGMAWNDTAQIDFLNPAAREAVRERILHVAKNFPVIRFDAAMVLAKRHIKRLWYPEPGRGGDVPSRSEHAMSAEAFDAAIPEEFWREVVDTCAKEAPDTLLLAEAFWMMEGYFVRTLGMHRVYNSAFMNMLKREENAKYRETIRNTQEFDPEILKRFVNFMNNPDEEPAIAQFGSGDKYFGVCTLMATMPGLPMFGHGQVEGFSEKYGMEYRRSYHDEKPNQNLVDRHAREIFPLLKRRGLYAGVENFYLYDFRESGGAVNENVFAYSNGIGSGLPRRSFDESARRSTGNAPVVQERGLKSLVLYNNAYGRTSGSIAESCPVAVKLDSGEKKLTTSSLARALGIDASPEGFFAMRELKSGLWRLYRCRDVIADGLRFDLDGYACEVFLDLHLIDDSAEGTCASVCDAYAGRGIPNLRAAFADAKRPVLYAAFDALVQEGLSRFATLSLADAAAGPDGGTPAGNALRARATAFYTSLLAFMRGEAAEIPEGRAIAEGASDAGVEKAAFAFGDGLELLVSARDALSESSSMTPSRKTGAAIVWCVLQAARHLVEDGSTNGNFARVLGHFDFGRKAKEVLDLACAAPSVGGPRLDALGWCIAYAYRPSSRGWNAKVKADRSALRRALELATWATENEAAMRCLGVNSWEGVEYFSKELFEEAVEFSLLLSGAEELVRRENASGSGSSRDVAAILLAAERESGFRTSRFILVLETMAAAGENATEGIVG